ncbi:ABC transporter ATP-binding protein [Enterovirga sp. CN4-39]|uniref:ABC transporter ATP-binding protein n=1 Tax=Enterovirga sp. CN4-39 TaxID=3400910 RepID=UPI003C002E38
MALIEFNNVGKAFTSRSGAQFVAVQDFSLQIQKGEFFCLLGPSGCGKTTVLGMLAGFAEPTTGRITVDGATISGPTRDRGVVFQGDDSLFGWLTALDNIEFGLRLRGLRKGERRDTAMRYLELVGLHGQQDKFPAELSGGMKQRIQIARALANEPKILLMDEPFGALDAQTREIMQRELRQICTMTGSSVLFITHDIDEAIALGSRVGIMTAGPAGTLKDVISIELEERSRTDMRYVEYYAKIQGTIRHEVERATRQHTRRKAA